jgi:uncharacterized repeat protein (TIGR01451 family)
VTYAGPSQAKVDDEVLLTFTIANTTGQALTGLQTVVQADAGLKPVKASDGWDVLPAGGLRWTRQSLAPGEKFAYQVLYRCLQAGPRLCARLVATSQEGARGEAEAGVEVAKAAAAPAPAPTAVQLVATVAGLWGKVKVGNGITYEIRVKNTGTVAAKQVVVAADVPEAMAVDDLGTSGPDPVKYDVKNNIVTFTALETLPPGEVRVYHVRASAKREGIFHFGVDVTAAGLQQPIHAEDKTEVFQDTAPPGDH